MVEGARRRDATLAPGKLGPEWRMNAPPWAGSGPLCQSPAHADATPAKTNDGDCKVRLRTKLAVIGVSLAALVGASAGTASADTNWQKHHPRREEVNARLMRQDHRIAMQRREGDLTRAQAHMLRREDRGVRAQERFDAMHHRGHLTRHEMRRLNHEENAVSRQIGR